MIGARVCMIAGLAGVAATMPAIASAQDCPEWLRWACSNSASSNPVREAAHERRRARTPSASTSQMDPTTKHMGAAPDGATPQQTKRWETTHAIRAARNTGGSDLSGDQRPARHGHDGVRNDQEREALFQEFSAWQKARRLDANVNSDPSGDQRSVVMNEQEKEALFQQFSAWQKSRRLNADANR
jgi:hypothetical protein